MFNYSPVAFQYERNATIWLIMMDFILAPGVYFKEHDAHNHALNIHCTNGSISFEHHNSTLMNAPNKLLLIISLHLVSLKHLHYLRSYQYPQQSTIDYFQLAVEIHFRRVHYDVKYLFDIVRGIHLISQK